MATAGRASMDTSLRWMITEDYQAVCKIESYSSQNPWTIADFKSNLRPCNSVGLVLEHDYNIYGYIIYILHDQYIEITNLAVAKEHRRKGFGSLIIKKLQGKLCTSRRTHLDVVVDEYNTGAHLFLKSTGFKAIQVLKGDSSDKYLFSYNILTQ